jgi:hypothetical protein
MSRTLSVNCPMPAVHRLNTLSLNATTGSWGTRMKIDDADEHEVAVGFLADFFAQQRALQIGEDSGGSHKFILSCSVSENRKHQIPTATLQRISKNQTSNAESQRFLIGACRLEFL